MAETALSFLLEELKETLKWYKDLLSGSENEFQQLNDDLKFMKAFLRDAGDRPKKEETFKEIERQIREVVYDVEDAVDKCLTAAAAAKAKSSIRRHLSSSKVSLATEVKSLREDKVKPVLEKVKAGFAALGGAGASPTGAEQPPARPKKVNHMFTFSPYFDYWIS